MRSLFEVFHTRKPSTDDLKKLWQSQRDLPVTYSEIGETLGPLPEGWHHLTAVRQVHFAPDIDGFSLAREAIRNWTAQRELNLVLEPINPPMIEGSVLVFAFPMKPTNFWTTGACRIVKIVDEPDRFGFVYGTLPHHPECGEEAFLVERDSAGPDSVTFQIVAFSRGGSLPMRLSGPVGRMIQHRAAETYLNGYEKALKRESPDDRQA